MTFNRMGPPCPYCGSYVTDVKTTVRSLAGDFWRRRDCPSCGRHFNTAQHAEIIATKDVITWHHRKVEINWRACRTYFATLVT